MENEKRMVVVTTNKDRRGVFFGELVSDQGADTENWVVKLADARMAIYWSSDTHGVTGLAATGPKEGSRISPSIPKIKLNGVTSLMDCSEAAINEWGKEKWD